MKNWILKMIDKITGRVELKVVQPINEGNSAASCHYLSVFFYSDHLEK